MTTQITLQLDLTTDTTGNAEQVARMIGVSAWHISGDYLVIEDPLLDYRVTDNETYSHKTHRIPNGAVVILVQDELEHHIEQEIESEQVIHMGHPTDPANVIVTVKLKNGLSVTGCQDSAEKAKDDAYSQIENYLKYEKEKFHTQNNLKEQRELNSGIDKLLETRIPILDQIHELCLAIENCGASPELTDAVTKAGALRDPISKLVDQALKLGIGKGIVSVSYSDNGSEPTPELPKLNNCDAVKPSEPTNDNQGNAYLLTQLLNTPNISSVLHKKAEAKMMALLDQLI